jgi:hypothetical protein
VALVCPGCKQALTPGDFYCNRTRPKGVSYLVFVHELITQIGGRTTTRTGEPAGGRVASSASNCSVRSSSTAASSASSSGGISHEPRVRWIIRMTELLHAEQEPYAGKVRTALFEACGVKERYA